MRKIKKGVLKITLLSILLAFSSFEEPKLKRIKATENISVMLPATWHPMDELDFSERFPSVRAPLFAYTDEDRQLSFSINISATQWPDANANIAQRFFKASLFNMFDKVEIVREGIRTVNKKQFIFFEFESTVRGNARELDQQSSIMRYTSIAYLVQPERTLVFSFTCPRRLRQDWEATALRIMESIRVK